MCNWLRKARGVWISLSPLFSASTFSINSHTQKLPFWTNIAYFNTTCWRCTSAKVAPGTEMFPCQRAIIEFKSNIWRCTKQTTHINTSWCPLAFSLCMRCCLVAHVHKASSSPNFLVPRSLHLRGRDVYTRLSTTGLKCHRNHHNHRNHGNPV